MDSQQFNEIVEEQLQTCRDVLVKKASEYATEDRLHNFKVAAELSGGNHIQALGGMMAKHTVSVYDMIYSDDSDFPMDLWDEKITDHINYLLLLRTLVVEKKQNQPGHVRTLADPYIPLHND